MKDVAIQEVNNNKKSAQVESFIRSRFVCIVMLSLQWVTNSKKNIQFLKMQKVKEQPINLCSNNINQVRTQQ